MQTARAVRTLVSPFAFGSMQREGGRVWERPGFAQTHTTVGTDAILGIPHELQL